MVYYLSGPMTGLPEHNFPAFREATAWLRRAGKTVVSPHELDEGEDFAPGAMPWSYYLRRDLRQLTLCNVVAVLDGWENSKGAQLEVHVARALGMPVVNAWTLVEVAA